MLQVTARKRLREIALDVDLTFLPGVTTLVGPSGAGKSTLLRIVAGLVHPDSGMVRLGDTLLDDAARGYYLAPGKRNCSLVFQEYALFPHLNVAANVAYGLAARRVPRAERHRRVQDMLDRLGIGSLGAVRPGKLSGGQRQRVALARALVLAPRALLLDEPLAALDVQTRSTVRQELRAVLADLAIPTLLVTHDYADALVFRERIVILADGTVLQEGTHEDLLAHPRSRFVADFTGVNYLEGMLETHEPDRSARIRIAPDVEIYAPVEAPISGPVSVSVHPWDITLFTQPPEGSARNVLPCRVREILPLGSRVRLTLGAGYAPPWPWSRRLRRRHRPHCILPRGQSRVCCLQGHRGAGFTASTVARDAPRPSVLPLSRSVPL